MAWHRSDVGRAAGEVALLRSVYRGHIASATPVTVVEDSDERVVVFLRCGTPIAWIGVTPLPPWVEAGYPLLMKEWDDTDRLFIWPRGRAHAVSFLWEAATGNEACFYVDALEPWRETPLGWDTCDQELDLVIWPDLSEWFWKDVEQFEDRIRLGFHTASEGVAIRAELESVARDIEARRGLWAESEAWRAWRPDPSWPTPSLPDGWDVL